MDKKELTNKKQVKAFYNSFHYSGFLLSEDSTRYEIYDTTDNSIIYLPKSNTVLKIVGEKNERN